MYSRGLSRSQVWIKLKSKNFNWVFLVANDVFGFTNTSKTQFSARGALWNWLSAAPHCRGNSTATAASLPPQRASVRGSAAARAALSPSPLDSRVGIQSLEGQWMVLSMKRTKKNQEKLKQCCPEAHSGQRQSIGSFGTSVCGGKKTIAARTRQQAAGGQNFPVQEVRWKSESRLDTGGGGLKRDSPHTQPRATVVDPLRRHPSRGALPTLGAFNRGPASPRTPVPHHGEPRLPAGYPASEGLDGTVRLWPDEAARTAPGLGGA
ncbi:hypothetical protein FB451DRAFT_1432960 [Mycena latifolia]|nr:hypothetical protein FB451DRAFT_1432960 [Mycena latifolia]